MEQKQLLHLHPSIRNSLPLLVWPALGIVGVWVLKGAMGDRLHPTVAVVLTAVLLVFPIYAWIRKYFETFVVLETSVYCRKGLLSKNTFEIRFVDIRAINVRQSVIQRILRIGQVGFASAAGDDEEVTFHGVPDPEGIKRLVQGRMPDHHDEAPRRTVD